MQSETMQSETMQSETMQSDTILQDQLITLVTEINAQNLNTIREITVTILYNSLCVKTSKLYVSLLYRLIFHTYKENPLIAFHILSGFIKFGQCYNTYKPLIDYFVMEAFNALQKEYGWAILKPCAIALREIDYTNETLFQHMIGCVVRQLKQDTNDMPYSSDLCFNLPREKSYTWGWFSFDIARAYCSDNTKEMNAKQLRNNMMLYRKLLTKLRKNVLDIVRITNEPTVKIEENWNSILNVLAKYYWAADIIDETLNDDESEVADGVEGAQPFEDGVEGAEPFEDGVEETEPQAKEEPLAEPQEQPLAETPDGVEGAEPLAEPQEQPLAEPKGGVEGAEPLEKNNSWLYKLFGW